MIKHTILYFSLTILLDEDVTSAVVSLINV